MNYSIFVVQINLATYRVKFKTSSDRYYPLLKELTPQSIIITSIEESDRVSLEIDFSVFVRGDVKSNKSLGWDACVARDRNELFYILEQIFAYPHRSRGRAIIRQLVPLRYKSWMPGGFPQSREYRLFVCDREVFAFGYYWDEFEDEFYLTEVDRSAIFRISLEAARRVDVPYLIVDVGQLESGDWTIIEIGDAQFAGMSHVSILELWGKLAAIDPQKIL